MSKSTFTRIIQPGKDLAMEVKIIQLRNSNELTDKQIQAVCSALANHHEIAATPYRLDGLKAIAINTKVRVPCRSKEVENNNKEKLTITFDFSLPKKVLRFSNPKHQQMLGDLYMRNFAIEVNKTGKYKRINSDSSRIFYERKAFRKEGDIGVFRRFELSDVIIDGVGIGINVAVGTTFFSLKSVADYYADGEEERLHHLMNRMSMNINNVGNRGRERRGTLTFYAPNRIQTCYFEKFLTGETCSSPDQKRINGVFYNNLIEYYQRDNGYVSPNDAVAMVSFRELSNVRVPAKKLFVRIFNDKLPWELANEDKIDPDTRELEVNKFWNSLGRLPNGNHYNDFNKYRFYRPSPERSGTIRMSGLVFGKNEQGVNATLPAPDRLNLNAYKDHFRNRKRYLDKYGCFHVPPTIEQEIYFPFPASAGLSDAIKEQLASDVCTKVSHLTHTEVDYVILNYDRNIEAAYTLKQEVEEDTGMTVFTFDGNDPTAYYQISSELQDWGLKRLTVRELRRKYQKLIRGQKNKWDSYIDLIAYDVVQQMNCVPWVLTKKLNYNIHLAIDVSEKHRYYDLSLMVQNDDMPYPIFVNQVRRKTDDYIETINAVFLEEGLKDLFESAKYSVGDTLNSNNMLIYRDGKDCKTEFKTIQKIIPNLISDGYLKSDLQWDFVEYRKSMMKGLRVYDIYNRRAYRSLEGTFFDVQRNKWSILNTTGAATVRQGTPNPISINNTFTNGDMAKIKEDIFLSAQYNFSSPSVAQRLSHPLKKADEELQKKMAEEVKGMRTK